MANRKAGSVRPLKPTSELSMIATIDLGGTRTKYGLVDGGSVVCASSCPADAQGSLEAHLGVVLELLRSMCDQQGITLMDCGGLGVLSTGLVDNRAMRVLSTNGKHDDATGFDFRKWARERIGLELRMENDARGALLGEWRYGAGRGVDNLMIVTLGTGVGTAVMLDGKLLTGPHFSAGILGGHIIVNSGGRKCTCGAVGCLETEASGWVLPILVREHSAYVNSSLNGVEELGFRELLEHAGNGDTCAKDVLEHMLRYWGEALVSFTHCYDPERIIIGGGMMNAPDLVLASLRETVSCLAWVEGEQVALVPAKFPDDAGLIGASALFREEWVGSDG